MYIPIRLSSLRFANDGTANISSAKTSLAFLFTLKQTAGGKVYIKCRGVYYYFFAGAHQIDRLLFFVFVLFFFVFFFLGGGGYRWGFLSRAKFISKTHFLNH